MTYQVFINEIKDLCKRTKTHEPKIYSMEYKEEVLLHEHKENHKRLCDIVESDEFIIKFPFQSGGFQNSKY